MKVCFVSLPATALFYPDTRVDFSGAEVQLFQLARFLAKDNEFKPSFVVEDGGSHLHKKINKIDVYGFNSGAKKFSRIPVLRMFFIWTRLFALLDLINPDVIIQRSAGFMVFALYLYSRMRRKKFVYMISHDWDVNGIKKKKLGLSGILFEYAMTHSDLTIAQTKWQRDGYMKAFKKMVPIIHNSYPLYRMSKKRNYILAVTRLVSWKNPDMLYAVADRFPQERFVFIASKRDDRQLHARFVRCCRMRSNVEYIEQLPFSKNEDTYSHAKALLLISEAEGMPNVMLQAAAAGTPTISLSLDPERFISRGSGLCANGDFEYFISLLAMVIRDQSASTKMGETGRQMVEHDYWDKAEASKFTRLLGRFLRR